MNNTQTESTVFSIDGTVKNKVSLPVSIFFVKPNNYVLHDAIRMYLANKRQGTVSTKGRSEVRGGGKKPYRQKHTGRARAGTIRSPIRRGGGVVFGPKPRDYSFKIPKKVKRLATCSAFSLKREENAIKIVDSFDFEQPKTKQFMDILNALQITGKKILFLTDRYSKNVFLSARNIPKVKIALAKDANAYDILWSDVLVLTKDSIEIVERTFKRKSAKVERELSEIVKKSTQQDKPQEKPKQSESEES
ncbi:MAG: 50S ribosomal protein L4 [Candidatus Cloacimonas sp. 4484_209]|nr:MAG: 50S ribosomal protein L4 [Candidatus Cloacimonas sp. 4484_209]